MPGSTSSWFSTAPPIIAAATSRFPTISRCCSCRPIRQSSTRRKIFGMKSARKSSRTTRSNLSTPCAPSSSRPSSISNEIQKPSNPSRPSPTSSGHSDVEMVSVKETSICIVDDTGRIVREVKVASEPEALLPVLKNRGYHFKRIGLEAGPLSQWLYSALAEAGLPVICVETRHMRAVLKAQINKTDRNDARVIAQMMRVGLYRPVHVKTLRSQKLRML